MAGTRGRSRRTSDAPTPRRSLRKRHTQDEERDDLPDVVREMLHEERTAKRAAAGEDKKPLKKRKTAHAQRSSSPAPEIQPLKPVAKPATARHSKPASQTLPPSLLPYELPTSIAPPPQPSRVRQTIEDSDESDDDSDMEWEDALGDGGDSGSESEAKAPPQIGDVSITIGGKKSEEVSTKKKVRRRAITSVDRKRRLDIHKMHVLCLLYHVHRRNAWCNDARVQSALRKLVEPKVLTNLVPIPDLTQYSASKRFVDALNELKIMWAKRFKATAQGMSKPKWAEPGAEVRPFSDFDELDNPMDKNDFRTAARTLQGSSDVGGQLFCALLRGIGIETRLVCSLQELPFASAAQPSTPQKPAKTTKTITVDPYNKIPAKSSALARNKKLSRLERIMGERHPVLNKAGTGPKRLKSFQAPYPVYWVEVFNSAHQKWVPIDPLSTFTINAPEKLEPPFSYTQNSLTYVIAFEADYTAHDVTRRYAKAYNAKTLKFRVETTSRGAQWWTRTLRYYTRPSPLPRDTSEEATLARKVAAEGIPKNVQDFKSHPVYVLERHLKHSEVIHPLEIVGKVNVGSAMNPRMEPIYRRRNVHTVRSADKWYRLGRDVLPGEQALKHAKPKKNRLPSIGPDERLEDVEPGEQVGAALYAEFQTEIYIPPPVVRGRVPRNAYGNLDLYVPSMVPPGGVHVRHKLASKAARLLQIDYADAVTGFNFKGRHGTAVVQGCVISAEYADAVEQTIEGFEYLQIQAQLDAHTAESLRLWRRFYLGLRIAQRVNAIEIDGQRGDVVDVQKSIDYEEQRRRADEMAGGFLPEDAAFVEPSRPPKPDIDFGGGFVPDDEGFNEEEANGEERQGVRDADTGGGFLPINDRQDSDFELGGPSLNREESFGSVILESQELRPRRRSSFGEAYISSGSSPHRNGLDDSEDEESEWEDPAGFEKLEGNVELPEHAVAQPDNAYAGEDTGGDSLLPPTFTDTDSAMHDAFAPEEEQLRRIAEDDGVPDVQVVHPEVKIVPTDEDPPPISPLKSDISDSGSLLLEDPDDEDAEPDWLVDAT
ncbi:Rad4-domain-containing protein [Didymella exigua CBS 183.55]|uniref:Rad4-domain-containing protein n=1 Tax=Didymella exigua CBS 183.55 TaxID=1150837 RepID=A0A6A5RUH5_9PLEO|nr:Rad4-domain-containing protein [Didymella exigua CBS 183.55]KAF1929956.1 Rad4-domain-containing protein [Didymella exigua CBS 183.55]